MEDFVASFYFRLATGNSFAECGRQFNMSQQYAGIMFVKVGVAFSKMYLRRAVQSLLRVDGACSALHGCEAPRGMLNGYWGDLLVSGFMRRCACRLQRRLMLREQPGLIDLVSGDVSGAWMAPTSGSGASRSTQTPPPPPSAPTLVLWAPCPCCGRPSAHVRKEHWNFKGFSSFHCHVLVDNK